MRTALKFAAIYVGISAVLAVLWVVAAYPRMPTTAGQWLWMLALVLPLQIVGEFIGELVWNNKATEFVGRRTAAKSLSLLRILYGIVLLLMLTGVALGAAHFWHII